MDEEIGCAGDIAGIKLISAFTYMFDGALD